MFISLHFGYLKVASPFYHNLFSKPHCCLLFCVFFPVTRPDSGSDLTRRIDSLITSSFASSTSNIRKVKLHVLTNSKCLAKISLLPKLFKIQWTAAHIFSWSSYVAAAAAAKNEGRTKTRS